MGFTLLESQACGTPVVCTDAGAMHEFVDDGRTGFVVEQNSSQAIAFALKRIIGATHSLPPDYREKCRGFVKSLDWSLVVREHLRLYSASPGTN
jgi:glycosyltransferase involved in cell wall biosynthesis